MSQTIDRRTLCLVTEVQVADGPALKVHVTPLDQAVFETYFLEITRCFSDMMANGPAWMTNCASRAASLMLKRTAVAMGTWEGERGVQAALLPAIRAGIKVFAPVEGVWQMVPLDTAIAREMISPEDAAEVESDAVFFMVLYASQKRRAREGFAGALAEQATYSSASEYLSSLRTPTPAANTGEKAPPSAIPR